MLAYLSIIMLVNLSFHIITRDMQFKAENLRKIHHMKIPYVYLIQDEQLY